MIFAFKINLALRLTKLSETVRFSLERRNEPRLPALTAMEDTEFAKLIKPIALVVDDEPLILMDTSDMISDEGYAIIEARTADEAYEFLGKHSSLQLLVTDVQTPGEINGFELARKVHARWPHICIIVASGAARPQIGDLPDAVHFIAKPISASLVHEVIEKFCRWPGWRHDTQS